jgi:hypothetical protein
MFPEFNKSGGYLSGVLELAFMALQFYFHGLQLTLQLLFLVFSFFPLTNPSSYFLDSVPHPHAP